MELKDVVSVTGLPGLHKILGQNKNGLVLEALADGKKFSTNLRQRVSILSDISMFTDEGEVKLAQVIHQIKALEDGGTEIPNGKVDTEAAISFMGLALPNFDRERVYPSDMKKLFAWYHLIKGSLDFESLLKVEEENTEEGKVPKAADKLEKHKIAPTKSKVATKTAGGAKSKPSAPRKMGS